MQLWSVRLICHNYQFGLVSQRLSNLMMAIEIMSVHCVEWVNGLELEPFDTLDELERFSEIEPIGKFVATAEPAVLKFHHRCAWSRCFGGRLLIFVSNARTFELFQAISHRLIFISMPFQFAEAPALGSLVVFYASCYTMALRASHNN